MLTNFARLVLLLRDDEDIRGAMMEISTGLPRDDLDAGLKSSDIWENIIEKKFNDAAVKPVQFISSLRVRPQNAPVCFQDGSYLKPIYMRSRGSLLLTTSDIISPGIGIRNQVGSKTFWVRIMKTN